MTLSAGPNVTAMQFSAAYANQIKVVSAKTISGMPRLARRRTGTNWIRIVPYTRATVVVQSFAGIPFWGGSELCWPLPTSVAPLLRNERVGSSIWMPRLTPLLPPKALVARVGKSLPESRVNFCCRKAGPRRFGCTRLLRDAPIVTLGRSPVSIRCRWWRDSRQHPLRPIAVSELAYLMSTGAR